jgi:ABC-type sugar transport system ATPase subunit
VSLLSATGITKRYAGVHALRGVDFELRAGEIHAIAGENGAGKSTLIKVLGGAVAPDDGRVDLDGVRLPAGDPLAARRAGVSIVYQEFTLVPELTMAENVFLGRERGRLWLDRAAMNAAVQARLDELGLDLPPSTPVRRLSVAHQQLVEIARALVGDAKAIVLDEPTAALSQAEVSRLFAVMRRLRSRGIGVVFITHRLDEIFAAADRITVLRDGRLARTADAAALDRASLIRTMVGREMSQEFPARGTAPLGPQILEVRALAAPPRFADVSFVVHAGEIVALAGLVGAGRTSAALALIGALRATGEVRLNGVPVRFPSPADAIAAGLAYVTEDRKGRGLFPLLGVDANITAAFSSEFTRAGLIDRRREREAAADAARRFGVRAARLDQPAATLSGGNQQKALLARFLLRPRQLIVLDEPTRGVDVGARAEIYTLIRRLADAGAAILMISSDLPEVLGMADRIVVMRDGRTTGELSREQATAERVMALAS